MAPAVRAPMPRADRAKQFAPFSALKGLEEALEKKRLAQTTRRIPDEKRSETLNKRLSRIRAGERVYVMYYSKKGYIKRRLVVEDVDVSKRAILSDGEYVFFDDIYAIKIE